MSLKVHKYGGTSLGNTECIRRAAAHIARCRVAGDKIAVVVSAIGTETDELLAQALELSPSPEPRELDALLATGEQRSAALLCIALREQGVPAFSYNGAQLPIRTDGAYARARILELRTDRILQHLERDEVVTVTGFQGVDAQGNINTLGRGGSDTSAVALATVLGADECRIYTDVKGVYTADPRIVPGARRLDRLGLEEMLEMSGQGARVLQIRSVEMAGKNKMPLRVLSSAEPDDGTLILGDEERAHMESPTISGVTQNRHEAKLTILGVRDQPGIAARVLSAVAGADIVVDVIVQNIAEDGRTDLSFTVHEDDLEQTRAVLEQVAEELGARGVDSDKNIAKLSVVGAGMRSHAGVAGKMFSVLADEGANIQMIATSEIKITVIIEEEFLDRAVRALHAAFELEQNPNQTPGSVFQNESAKAEIPH